MTEFEPLMFQDSIIIEGNRGRIELSFTGNTMATHFLWSNEQGKEIYQENAASSAINNLISGIYTVEVTDENQCKVKSTYDVKIPFVIPTLITPNNDGLNDTWKIGNIESFDNISIQIFNRWGNRVFLYEGSGMAYGDVSNQFDGTYNGKELSIGGYIYIIDLKDGTKPKQGTVSIVRTKK